MRLIDLQDLLQVPEPGAELHSLITRLYPICRSMTGDGVRRTLDVLRELIPIDVHDVPTGTPVFDWVVPKEWNIRDAYVMNGQGRRVIDFRSSNLHVVGNSIPVHRRMSLQELRGRLHSIPEKPAWIPYRTSYYREDWGFCLSHQELERLEDGDYDVVIDSTLTDGSLTYGELIVPGVETGQVLISAHVCHPSLCNDNLSGIAVACFLARYIAARSRAGHRPRYTYRFLFAPATIGAITWLARNETNVSRVQHGLVLTLLGDAGSVTYKRSQRGNTTIDRAVELALAQAGEPYAIRDFVPYGYDERQFCSPGFDLAVGCLMRTPHAEFPEYHTSGDNLDFVKPESLRGSLDLCLAIVDILEADCSYLNLNPKGEPQLGKRGLYRAFADRVGDDNRELAVLWVLNQSDGTRSLLDIASRSRLRFELLSEAALLLEEHGLVRRIERDPTHYTPS